MSTEARPKLAPLPPSPRASGRQQPLNHRLKRVLLGRALKTSELHDEKIRKRIALAVFSSDAISSTAYATEEMLLVLVLAGTTAIGLALPVSLAIVGLLAILVLSYRQIITQYSSSGGAYVVTRDNFGPKVAQVAGAALVIDYVMTVAVSVSSGTAALVSAFQGLEPLRVPIAVAFILLLTWGNLRGLKEAGRAFAVPTYVYVASLSGLVVYGAYRWFAGDLGVIQYTPDQVGQLATVSGPATATVTLFLIMHAFSSGTTALTGVEAVSNGVSAFRDPQARNARATLVLMGTIMSVLFLGVTFLATKFQAQPYAGGNPTLLAQIAEHILGTGPAFLLIQFSTLAVLVLAANTSYSSFPLLASFAADDAILPRQLRKRGHRLAYSNGILVLAAAALGLVVAFRADTHLLIPLYAIGVVLSFTLAQAGMAKRRVTHRTAGWWKGAAICGLGTVVTAVVLVVIVLTKFRDGAWMVVIAIPLIVFLLRRVQATYVGEDTDLAVEAAARLAPPKPRHEVLVFLDDIDRAAVEALQYARQLNPLSITAVHFAIDPDEAREVAERWARVEIPIALDVIDCPERDLVACAEETVRERLREDTELTVLVPKRGYTRFWRRILHDRTASGLVRALGDIDGVNVTLVPFTVGRQPLAVPAETTDERS